MAGDLNKFVERMRYWCEKGNLGYDQYNRWDIRVGGESDCSSLVYWCLWEAGFLKKPSGNLYEHTLYTGVMKKHLTAAGWKVVPNNGKPKVGDILLNEVYHVGVWVGTGVAQSSIDENGNAHGGKSGDQTGRETNITNGYYNYPWDFYLRYEGETEQPKATETEAKTAKPAEIRYRASIDPKGKTWLDECTAYTDASGDGYAGIKGKPILWLAIKVDGWYQVKTKNGWLPKVYKYSTKDLVNGCAGDGTPILAVRIKPNSGTVRYAAAPKGKGWLPDMLNLKDTGGGKDDFAGNGKAIDRFRAKRER